MASALRSARYRSRRARPTARRQRHNQFSNTRVNRAHNRKAFPSLLTNNQRLFGTLKRPMETGITQPIQTPKNPANSFVVKRNRPPLSVGARPQYQLPLEPTDKMPGFRFQQVRRFQTGLRRTRLSPSVRRAIRLSKTRRGRALARRFVSSFAEETRQVTTKPTAWENLSPTGKAMVSVGLALGVAGLGSVYMSGMTTDAAMLMDTEVPLSPAVREMLRSTFGYTATGLGATAAAAFAFYRTGWAERSAQMGFLGTIGLLIAMIVAMTITSGIDYENTLPKHLAWLTAMSIMGFFLAPFAFLGVEILTKAAFATAVLMGSISVAAASAPSESFLWMQGYLSVGCGLLLAASLATFFFPASPMLEAAVLYGGLGLFSVFQLYDVQKVIAHSQKAESRGMMIDPINESFAIYMNIINVFIRLAMIFANQSNRRR